jgi:hypothetical protein
MHKYGSKFVMELESGTTLHNSNAGSSLLTFPNVVISRFEEKSEVFKVGEIWIPKAFASLDCLIKIFIPRIKNLLQEGDMILKAEAGGGMSRLISWKLYLKSNQGLKWQLKGANEQSYTIQVSNMFSPMVEGRHIDFFA